MSAENIKSDKYLDFFLDLKKGFNTRELRSRTSHIPGKVFTVIAKAYSMENDADLGIFSALEFGDGKYAVLGGFGSLEDKYTNCNYLTLSKPYENCGIDFLIFVDLKSGAVFRADNRGMAEIGENGLMETGGLQGYDTYGCLTNFALQSSDLNLDGKSEVFFFGGSGEFEHRGEGRNLQTILKIYSGTTYQGVFSEELSYENFVGQRTYGVYVANQSVINYQYISNSRLDKNGLPVSSTLEPAIRRYAKLYFLDVDENGLLDILIWRKILSSRKLTDRVRGYELLKYEYVRYEESSAGFRKKPMDQGAIKNLIDSFSLSWEDGFPTESYCEGAGKIGTLPITIDGLELKDY